MSDLGQQGEHEMELLLNRTEKRGVTRYLVRWRSHTSADDEWLLAEELPSWFTARRKWRSTMLRPHPVVTVVGIGHPVTPAISMPTARHWQVLDLLFHFATKSCSVARMPVIQIHYM